MSKWLNGSIQTQFRTIDGLSIRYAESDPRDDHALLMSPWPESLLAFADAGVGIAVLPSDAVWQSSKRHIVSFGEPSLEWTHAVHWRRGEETLRPELSHLLRELREIMPELTSSD